MKLSEFDYTLPKEKIAQVPLPRRDGSRLLVLHRESGCIEHRTFRDLVDYLCPRDLLVLNDTKVVRARILGRRATGGKVEALLLQQTSLRTYETLLNPSSKLKVGNRLFFEGEFEAQVIGGNGTIKTIRFKERGVEAWVRRKGLVPLPPYIRRTPEREDRDRYQTVYAKKEGAVAAPTAGLHFTKALLQETKEKGIHVCGVTLHVGYGTFEPVREEELTKHKMHEEYFEINKRACRILNETRQRGGRVVAVGTTSCRVLETSIRPHPIRPFGTLAGPSEAGSLGFSPSLSPQAPLALWETQSGAKDKSKAGSRARSGLQTASRANGVRPLSFQPMRGWTELFIYPPYEFRGTDALLTNFHLPKSTLLMLVSAFAGMDLTRKAYREAIEKGYRFYSYGDAMLIL